MLTIPFLFLSECQLENIGKPVFHLYSDDLYGSWMQDAVNWMGESGKKIWMTKSANNQTLYEYSNKTMYRRDLPTRNFTLPLPFSVSWNLQKL